MYLIKKSYFILFIAIALVSCKKEKFKTNNSEFQHIYNGLINSGKEADITWDTEVHSYSFILSEDRSISSIGYQSHHDLRSTDYVIDIINNIDSSIIYSSGHQFNSKKLSYTTPTNPIKLLSGVPYTLNRIQTNWGQNVETTIGHLIKTEASDYPISYGILTISETNFYDLDPAYTWMKYKALPRINIVFE